MPPRAVSIKTTHHAHCYICIGKLVLTSHVVSCVFIFSSFFCLPAQLGWYSDHEEDLTGFSLPGNDCTQMIEQQIDLVGLAEYDLASNDQKVIIKIPEPSKQRSFYVMYNRAIGINSGTDEAVDLVAPHVACYHATTFFTFWIHFLGPFKGLVLLLLLYYLSSTFPGFAIDRSKKYIKTIKIYIKIDAVDP